MTQPAEKFIQLRFQDMLDPDHDWPDFVLTENLLEVLDESEARDDGA